MDDELTTRAAARLARVSVDTVQRWVDSGRLGRKLPSGHRRVSRDELKLFQATLNRGLNNDREERLRRAHAAAGGKPEDFEADCERILGPMNLKEPAIA